MNKYLLFFLLIILFSCSSKSGDIKLSDLGRACEYIDASIKLVDAANNIRINNKNIKMGEVDKEQLQLLDQKIKDIRNASQKKYTLEEFKECQGYEILLEKFHKYSDLRY